MPDPTLPDPTDSDLEQLLDDVGEAEELLEAFQDSAAELRETVNGAIGDPVFASLGALDADALLYALQNVDARDRRQVLGELGLHGGKTPTKAVAQLAARKLHASDPRLWRWVALVVGAPTWDAIARAGRGLSKNWAADPTAAANAVATMRETPRPLVRLAIAAYAQRDDGYVAPAALAQLFDDGLILESWLEARDSLKAACLEASERLADVLARMEDVLESDAHQTEETIDVADVQELRDDERTTYADAEGGAARSTSPMGATSALNQARSLLEVARSRHREAVDAATRAESAVRAGTPPSAPDIESLMSFGSAFASLTDEISSLAEDIGVGDAVAISSLDDAQTTLDEIDAAMATDEAREVLSGVEKVAALPESHALSALYRGALERALELLARPLSEWSEGDRSDARQLAAIASANEAAADGTSSALSADDFRDVFRAALGLAVGGALPTSDASAAKSDVPSSEPADKEADLYVAGPGPSEDELPSEGIGHGLATVSETAAPSDETAEEPGDTPPIDQGEHVVSPAQELATPTAEQAEDESEAAVAVLAQLTRERRFGLAYWLARSIDVAPIVVQTLQSVAYADKIRAPAGECAGAFRQVIEEIDLENLRSSRAGQLLGVAAGVPAAIFSPYSGATNVLRQVALSFSDHGPLSDFLSAVITAAERGVQIEAAFVQQTRDLASLEAELGDIQRRAAQLRQPRKLVFARASDVWRRWIETTGPLGSLLAIVEAGEDADVSDIERRVLELRDQRELDRLIDNTDRALRRKTARAAIEARARQALLKGANEALDVVGDWVDLMREREARRQTETERAWQRGPMDVLRAAALENREAILALADAWETADDPLEASAGSAARLILDDQLLLLGEGRPLAGSEPPAYLVLGEELLKAPDVALSPTLEPLDGPPGTSSLLHAAATDDWSIAFGARDEVGDHEATQHIIRLVAQTDPELAEKLETKRESSLEIERAHIRRLHNEAQRALDAARRLAHITDEDWGRYYAHLEGLQVDTTLQLGASRRALDETLDALYRHRANAVEAAREEFATFKIDDSSIVSRVDRLLEAGDVAAYQELVLSVQRGLAMPEAEHAPGYVEEFFPAVIEAVATEAPRSDALLRAAEAGTSVGPFDFSAVGPERRSDVIAAMNAWLALAVNDRTEQDAKLRRIMWILGFDAEDIRFEESSRRRRGASRSVPFRSADLRARPVGRALVPAFGSAADGRYRVILALQQMTEESLLNRVAQEPGESPIIVLNLAFMSTDVRRGLIDQVRRQRRRALCVVDTAAFLYVCGKGGGLETLMRVTLPFTAVNPYTPFVAGKVPPEMFYGRKHELESVIDPNGTSFIYGGRRLGKSALLRAAEREFAADESRHAIYVDLKNQGIGEWRPATDVHDVLAREFTDRRIITSRRSARSPEELYDELLTWIEADEERRILLLLDEADEFLNADASEGFRIVRRLKELMDRTERRFKPVLAGLHQVQRFQSIPNQPLAHLGQPIAVGPLGPQYAFNLVATPLEALGYRFESDEAVFRILTNTNYQPSLLQLFCDELLKYMLKRPLAKDAPPYLVSMDDVERVYATPDLANEIRNRFELTINLDPRYRVIAYVLALHGLEAEVSASAIREECETWWPAGFEDTTDDEFDALLDELKGLGILYSADGRYTMRSPNVLRMLGTHDQIEDKLLSASEATPPQKFQAATFRAALTSDPYTRSPLTEQQASQLTRAETAVKVVLGSAATGIDRVVAAIETTADRASSRIEVLTVPPDRQRIKRAFAKDARGRHRLVICDIRQSTAAGMDLLGLAAELTVQPRETTASAVFVADAKDLGIWRAILGDASLEARTRGAKAVVLRRWSSAGLRAWAHSQDVDLPFMDDKAVERVLAATGGWPMLVDMLVSRYVHDHRFESALEEIDALVASPDGATALLEQTGLLEDSELAGCWRQVVEYGEPIGRDDLSALWEIDSSELAFDLLRALQTLEVSNDGQISPERVLVHAWTEAGPHTPRS